MKSTARAWPQTLITPYGILALDTASMDFASLPDDDQALELKLVKRFTRSVADGLTFLASHACDSRLSPSLTYWQDFARAYFRSLCRQGVPGEQWTSPSAPDETTLNELLQSAPPMKGLEYLTGEILVNFWNELDALS